MTMGMMNMRAAATKTTPSAVHAWAHENVQTRAQIIPATMAAKLMATCAVFGSPLFPLGSLSPCGARALFMNHLPFRLRFEKRENFTIAQDQKGETFPPAFPIICRRQVSKLSCYSLSTFGKSKAGKCTH